MVKQMCEIMFNLIPAHFIEAFVILCGCIYRKIADGYALARCPTSLIDNYYVS